MSLELKVQFNDTQVTVHYANFSPVTMDFVLPLTAKDREALRHYLEVYATQYVMDIDDAEAKRMIQKLPEWGQTLFNSIFSNAAAQALFTQFISAASDKHLLTITAKQPEILSLPWELLNHAGHFLFSSQPSVTILRRVAPKTEIPAYSPQKQLHILLIVSRPNNAGFIDPRTDARAVLQAIESYPFITVEFLQPATLENLWQRLQNKALPRVDVIHFDGHGYFDKTGTLKQTVLVQLSDHRELRKLLRDLDYGANTGYLLFEKTMTHDNFYVPTSWLAHLLSTTQVRLVVLSACQSAMVAQENEETAEEPIGGVAVGLVARGIPSVLAMSYSVMVRATELLFGEFYQGIAKGDTVGVALDRARHRLLQDTERRPLQRGQEKVAIHVTDWFLPTLYQSGKETALLTANLPSTLPTTLRHHLLALPEMGFWGRRRELWQIENWFIDGIRRVVISGFSGQGKTFLAQELGRWLLQKRYFDAVVFVDYSGYQGLDAGQWAVTSFSSVFEQTVMDVAVVDGILQSQRVLLILDNLEVYATDKQETLQELLAVADRWSQLGDTRVVITTRPVHLPHQSYQSENKDFRRLVLTGLDEQDAVDYFEQLLTNYENPVRLQRDELLHWFRKVQFHPLSLGLLARCLSAGDLANLETRLNRLMLELPDDPVKATLQLVIEQLDEESQKLLPLLGVFQGGALRSMLLQITELSEEQLSKLLTALRATSLVHPLQIPETEIIYFEFHPMLAPVLWTRLSEEKQRKLSQLYRRYYYQFSYTLALEDSHNPALVREVVKRELCNLWFAVTSSINLVEDQSAEFADKICRFLMFFGLQRDRDNLIRQSKTLEEVNSIGSRPWTLQKMNRGELLWEKGYYVEAFIIFQEVINALPTANYQRSKALARSARCLCFQGQLQKATNYYELALQELGKLDVSNHVVTEKSLICTELADILVDQGQYIEAEKKYKQSLAIKEQLGGDRRGKAVVHGQLGRLAILQGNLEEAKDRLVEAREIFHQLDEPLQEEKALHELGIVYYKMQQWEDSERAYRESARICEAQAQWQSAAQTWNNLGMLMQKLGKGIEAVAWYHKALKVAKDIKNDREVAIYSRNIANILQDQPNHLVEALSFAEQALAINKTQEPAVAEIWKTYNILANIADKQGKTELAMRYSRLSNEAKLKYIWSVL